MKKIMIVAAISMMALASCKKEYTCECTGGVVQDTPLPDLSKSEAEDACSLLNTTALAGGGSCVLQ